MSVPSIGVLITLSLHGLFILSSLIGILNFLRYQGQMFVVKRNLPVTWLLILSAVSIQIGVFGIQLSELVTTKTTSNLLITVFGILYHIGFFVFMYSEVSLNWLRLFNDHWTHATMQFKWTSIITGENESQSWFISNKNTFGNWNWIKPYIFFALIISIAVGVSGHLQVVFVSKSFPFMIPVYVFFCILLVIVLGCIAKNTPAFHDVYFIYEESKCHVIISIGFILIMFAASIQILVEDSPTMFSDMFFWGCPAMSFIFALIVVSSTHLVIKNNRQNFDAIDVHDTGDIQLVAKSEINESISVPTMEKDDEKKNAPSGSNGVSEEKKNASNVAPGKKRSSNVDFNALANLPKQRPSIVAGVSREALVSQGRGKKFKDGASLIGDDDVIYELGKTNNAQQDVLEHFEHDYLLSEIFMETIGLHQFMKYLSKEFSMYYVTSLVEISQFQEKILNENGLNDGFVNFHPRMPKSGIVSNPTIANMPNKLLQYKTIAYNLYQKYVVNNNDIAAEIEDVHDAEDFDQLKSLMSDHAAWLQSDISLQDLINIFNPLVNKMMVLCQNSFEKFKLTRNFRKLYNDKYGKGKSGASQNAIAGGGGAAGGAGPAGLKSPTFVNPLQTPNPGHKQDLSLSAMKFKFQLPE